jgi:outer membrane lipoprotein-sorting protein
MMRFLILIVCVLAAPAQASDKLSLSEISEYLNRLTSVRSTFTQINDDGTLSTGAVMIKRPGKMRFEYDPPDDAVVLAYAGSVLILDGKSNTAPETYPLSRTPLSIILARQVNLAQAGMVVGHTFDGTSTTVTAQDPDAPDTGRIDMVFTGDPVELRKWVVHDTAGGMTTVILGALETDVSLPDRMFAPASVER